MKNKSPLYEISCRTNINEQDKNVS